MDLIWDVSTCSPSGLFCLGVTGASIGSCCAGFSTSLVVVLSGQWVLPVADSCSLIVPMVSISLMFDIQFLDIQYNGFCIHYIIMGQSFQLVVSYYVYGFVQDDSRL